VEQVSWDDAQEFCKRASAKCGVTLRLPTEAEWEYACRAGTRTNYHSGDAEVDLARVGWYRNNSGNTTHPIGQKEANAFGLHDMHGNVWEWCEDWYSAYPNNPVTDPTGPATGDDRVLRGGSWISKVPVFCRSALRYWLVPDSRYVFIGFRVVLAGASRTP
jgi:formylglycine-generating enzyme required for sulfatase activity